MAIKMFCDRCGGELFVPPFAISIGTYQDLDAVPRGEFSSDEIIDVCLSCKTEIEEVIKAKQ